MFEYLKALMYAYLSPVLPKSEKGQDLAEYALLLGVIALVVVAAIIAFRDPIVLIFNKIQTILANAAAGS